MSNNIDKNFRLHEVINEDLTSSQGYGKITYQSSITGRETGIGNDGVYHSLLSKNTDVFSRVIPIVLNITDAALTQRLVTFIKVFTEVLCNIQEVSNPLSPMRLEIEDESVFLEWIFQDFRIGFTIAKDESESMWFLITNRNLDEISVTGDLREHDYQPVIVKILKYVLENT